MLIDSKSLIDRYCRAKCGHHATVCRYPCEVVRMIREEPEAVGHCDQCKYFVLLQSEFGPVCTGRCTHPSGGLFKKQYFGGPFYFCSFWERKEDNNA